MVLESEVALGDDKLHHNDETGHYTHSEIVCQEFFDVIAGNGPCNKQRMDQRRNAQDDGAWVREAARVYADKKAAASVAA